MCGGPRLGGSSLRSVVLNHPSCGECAQDWNRCIAASCTVASVIVEIQFVAARNSKFDLILTERLTTPSRQALAAPVGSRGDGHGRACASNRDLCSWLSLFMANSVPESLDWSIWVSPLTISTERGKLYRVDTGGTFASESLCQVLLALLGEQNGSM